MSDQLFVDDVIKCNRAITLTEPWATLMALGAKKNETRSKPSRYRGWLAVHSAKSFPAGCRLLSREQPFAGALTVPHQTMLDRLGHVIAVVRVVSCRETELGLSLDDVTPEEQQFGDYSPGRFYYVTDAVRRLRTPMPARGFQSIPWRLPFTITEKDLL